MKVGIVVPCSLSFRGGVVEHTEEQARVLEALGVETRAAFHAAGARRCAVASYGGPSVAARLRGAYAQLVRLVAPTVVRAEVATC